MKRSVTYSAKVSDQKRKWYIVDASGKILGRLACEVAKVIRGKDEEVFTRSLDTGDFVIVINAADVAFTGKKLQKKTYFRHSGYPHGAKSINLEDQMKKSPEKVIEHAVRGMLPRGRLGDVLIKKLKVYRNEKYVEKAQNPEELKPLDFARGKGENDA